MQVTKQKKHLSELLTPLKSQGKTIGFVPTMGALHAGHLSLMEQALACCDCLVVSIFVNPTQFDDVSDLNQYPRTLEKDIALLEKEFPKVIIFAPTASEVYGKAIEKEKFDFGTLSTYMEGKHRPGHFDGVGTVLKKLFNTVQPDKAFFGEKDYQQLLIVKKLVQLTGQPIEIIGCPIAREESGLARSSRNERLTPEQREEAAFIYQTLQGAKAFFGTKNVTYINDWVRAQFEDKTHLSLAYFEITNAETLTPYSSPDPTAKQRAFIAVFTGEIRLIDNIALN